MSESKYYDNNKKKNFCASPDFYYILIYEMISLGGVPNFSYENDGFGPDLTNKIFAILGVTFKPNTDDMREAPSLVILPELAKRGAKLKVYDPAGHKEGNWRFLDIRDSLTWCENAYEALENTDATVILTEWNKFRNLNFNKFTKI